jgi:hypothetical protein
MSKTEQIHNHAAQIYAAKVNAILQDSEDYNREVVMRHAAQEACSLWDAVQAEIERRRK